MTGGMRCDSCGEQTDGLVLVPGTCEFLCPDCFGGRLSDKKSVSPHRNPSLKLGISMRGNTGPKRRRCR